MMLASSSRPLLSLEGVVREISGSKETTKRLLNDVSWQMLDGERVGIISSSIREAHAFLDCAAGVVPVQKGQVTINANVSWPLGVRGGLLSSLTGRQNAAFLQGVYGHGGHRNRDLEVIQTLADLEEGFFDKPLRVYNKFMRARFYLAITLAFDFDVYIIPKIFAWKSDATSERLLRLQQALRERTEGKSLIMAHTDFNFLQQYCTGGVVLQNGKIAYTGSLDACCSWYSSNVKDSPDDDAIDNDVEEERVPASETDEDNEGLNADLW